MTHSAYLGIDLGAESGRAIIGVLENALRFIDSATNRSSEKMDSAGISTISGKTFSTPFALVFQVHSKKVSHCNRSALTPGAWTAASLMPMEN